MKILITGSTGFIGSHLLLHLTGYLEHTVLAVARHIPTDVLPRVRWVETDLCTVNWTKKLPDEEFDAIIHLAQSRNYREFPDQAIDIFDVNVKSTYELAEWGVQHCVTRFIFASTGNVYGLKKQIYNEEDHCEPESMYGASKLSAEILLKPFSGFMNVLVMRLFGVYGPSQKNSMLSGVIQRFMMGDEINLAGNVGVRINPIYIEDCLMLIHQLLKESRLTGYQLLNIGGSEIIDLKQVACMLENLTGKKALTRITADSPKEIVGCIEKLKKTIQFEEAVNFKEGFRRTFDSLKI